MDYAVFRPGEHDTPLVAVASGQRAVAEDFRCEVQGEPCSGLGVRGHGQIMPGLVLAFKWCYGASVSSSMSFHFALSTGEREGMFGSGGAGYSALAGVVEGYADGEIAGLNGLNVAVRDIGDLPQAKYGYDLTRRE